MDAAKRVNQLCEQMGIPHKNPGINAIPKSQPLQLYIFDKDITLDDIQGQWTNSDDHIFTVIGNSLEFIDDKESFEIKESDQKFEVIDWVLKKSSRTLTWKQENEEDREEIVEVENVENSVTDDNIKNYEEKDDVVINDADEKTTTVNLPIEKEDEKIEEYPKLHNGKEKIIKEENVEDQQKPIVEPELKENNAEVQQENIRNVIDDDIQNNGDNKDGKNESETNLPINKEDQEIKKESKLKNIDELDQQKSLVKSGPEQKNNESQKGHVEFQNVENSVTDDVQNNKENEDGVINQKETEVNSPIKKENQKIEEEAKLKNGEEKIIEEEKEQNQQIKKEDLKQLNQLK
jgi:hypothetical protein